MEHIPTHTADNMEGKDEAQARKARFDDAICNYMIRTTGASFTPTDVDINRPSILLLYPVACHQSLRM